MQMTAIRKNSDAKGSGQKSSPTKSSPSEHLTHGNQWVYE